jgi:hypothetical protein
VCQRAREDLSFIEGMRNRFLIVMMRNWPYCRQTVHGELLSWGKSEVKRSMLDVGRILITGENNPYHEQPGWRSIREASPSRVVLRKRSVIRQYRKVFTGGRKWDLLVYWALDRFTREGTLATLKYLEQLESYGIRWRSFTEPWIDSTGPFRDARQRVFELRAQSVSYRQIARRLGIGEGTVRRVLSS